MTKRKQQISLDPQAFLCTEMNVFWLDQNGHYLGCNDKVRSVFGITEAQILGHHNNDLVTAHIMQKSLADYLNQENALVLATQAPRLNIPDPVVIHVNGTPMHYVTNRFPLFDKNHNITGVFGLTIDVTDSLLVKKSGLFGYMIMAAHSSQHAKYLHKLFTAVPAEELPLITTKEAQCLYYILKGKSAREIGMLLHLSTRTIEGHIANAKDKLACKTRSELIDRILADIQLLYSVLEAT